MQVVKDGKCSDKTAAAWGNTGDGKMDKRNPYLQDYEEQRRLRKAAERKPAFGGRQNRPRYTQRAAVSEGSKTERIQQKRGRVSAARRRKIVRRQRMVVGLCGLSMLVLVMVIIFGKSAASAFDNKEQTSSRENDTSVGEDNATQTTLIQGLPAEVYAAHPDWTENFLTPNEYSRPGDPLEQVDNIFVHYTANQGTSAAQNRSYFEQQKDMHERSVSAHFIIGYEGEIIQCVPLDEIAYAVMTRNMDSISIECCYLEADGSFTQETYDSLISLLTWLAEAYDLEADDILRHYDCGGKKCPLYYTEHPNEWEKLKQDVRDEMKSSQTLL